MAQHPYYYTINDDNGLPSNEVYQLVQDDFGYMWLGCNSGLFRYDGFKFTQFHNQQQNSVAISGLTISADRKLYCQNFSGQIFYVDNDSLKLLVDVKEKTRSHPRYTIDKQHNVWICLPGGILKCSRDGKQEMLFRNELFGTEIEWTDNGGYVADARKGLIRISKNNNGIYEWHTVPDSAHIFSNIWNGIEKNRNRLFALSLTYGTDRYYIAEIKNDTVALVKQIPGASMAEHIYSVSLLNDKIWLGTSSGAYCLSLQGNVEQHLFPSEKISDVITDREGSYWFASLQNGIFVVPDMQLTCLNAQNSALPDNNITALMTMSGNELLIGTYPGDIYRYYIAGQKLEALPKNEDGVYSNVTAILRYDNDHIIAGRGSISVIDIAQKKEHQYSSIYIRDIVQSGDSIFYASSEKIGVISNISALTRKNDFHSYHLKHASGRNICFDARERLVWVTLNEGLASYENGTFDLFQINGQAVFCNKIYTDRQGLWAGTVSDGVYNIRDRKVELHLNNSDGLRGDNVKCITSLNDTVYIATDVCINIYHPDGSFSYLDYTDGINAKEINALSIAGAHLFIATLRGLYYLPIHASYKNNVAPNIQITSLYINGVKQSIDKPANLEWNNKDILITFSSVALRSRGRFNYLYRISGFQDEWRKLDGNINYVRLNHLPAGKYTFEVKAVNEDGIQSRVQAGIAVVVSIPFWQHWLFYLLIAVLSATFVALLFLLRIRTIRRNEDVRNKLANSQLTALKAQMNPHFMYNTLNSIQDLVLQQDIKSTNYYLSRYSSLMRKILDSSESNEIELTEETEILELYLKLEQLRFGTDFSYSITIAEHIEQSKIQIPSMIIQPFVENAIKHGLLHKKGIKSLTIIFTQAGDILTCTITDNGIGRAKAAEIKQRSEILKHKSFATKATEKRLELINTGRKSQIRLKINDLYNDGMATGTEVIITIPL